MLTSEIIRNNFGKKTIRYAWTFRPSGRQSYFPNRQGSRTRERCSVYALPRDLFKIRIGNLACNFYNVAYRKYSIILLDCTGHFFSLRVGPSPGRDAINRGLGLTFVTNYKYSTTEQFKLVARKYNRNIPNDIANLKSCRVAKYWQR